MATSLDVLLLSVLTSVLLLLVVARVRKVREYPLVMRCWWATSTTFRYWIFVFFDGQDYDLRLGADRHAAEHGGRKLRKDWEYPLVLYNWWATPTTFDCVVLELLGLPWRGGFNVDFVHYMATSTSSTSSSTLVCGTLGTTVSTASVFVDLVYYKLVDGVCCGTSTLGTTASSASVHVDLVYYKAFDGVWCDILTMGAFLLALTMSPRRDCWRRWLWWLPQLCYDLVLCSAAFTVLYLCWLVGGWLL
ncbi:unnamed protein product [Symbiodinium microadriaticum]|nr:unnamed protein product [Symbiodinium microadriaticum]CAE7784319.1 unnamed protein product [Symbiodinium sp. KB8]